MNSEPTREEALFQAASQLAGPERAAFLNGACHGDPALRGRLDALLAAHEASVGVLADEPAREVLAPTLDQPEPAPDETVGMTLGRYKLREKLGEGGCGTVYVAEQTEPVRRKVALKVIKLGMDTREVIARFEAERQALAMMDHPNIAKVLDAGTTDAGRPYFVMELVRGIKITDYCDQANLSTKERLDLFIKVCQAIQHAHQKGIIHRDIKPGNILVTLHDGVPVPKVIDFGIAKATEGRLTDNTVYTQLHQFMGTPAYMSPEQAEMSGLDVDTRSDIYSLGVLLYQLLTSKTPFDGKELLSMGLDAMRKTIREKEPMRPSTRLATLQGEELTTTAKRRASDAPKLIHLLKGDLDWIVMKCLEKDRARRYETANGLAADLKRHLDNEPVVARPASNRYKIQKAFRRNKLAFAAAMAVALSLLIGIAASTWQAVRATRAEQQESRLRQRSEESAREADQQRTAAQAAEKIVAQQAWKLGKEVYAVHMERAAAGLSGNDLFRTRKELNACDPQFRGWEWHFVNDSTRLLLTVPGREVPLFTPDGRHLITCDPIDRGRVRIFDASSGALVAAIPLQQKACSPALSPNGRRLALGDESGTIVLWDLAAQKQIWSFQAHTARIDGIVFSGDGSKLASAGWDGSLKLLRADNGVVLREWRFPENRLRCPALSPNGRYITVAGPGESRDGRPGGAGVIVWDTANGDEIFRLTNSTERVRAVTFSPDGKWIVTGGKDGIVRQWNATNGEWVRALAQHAGVNAVVFSKDGRMLASVGDRDNIQLHEFEGGQLIHTLPRNPRSAVMWLSFSADGTKLAAHNYTQSAAGEINVFDVTVREQNHVLKHASSVWSVPRVWSAPRVWSVAYSADGKRLVSGGADAQARVWDSATGEMLRALRVDDGRFIAFSPDSLRVLSGGLNGSVGLWEVANGSLVRRFPGSEAYVQDGALSPDGRRVAAAGRDKVLRLWETATGRLLREFRGHETNNFGIYSAAFSPDGLQIATGSADNTVRLWEADSGRLMQTLRHVHQVTAVTFSPDGRTVAGGGADWSVPLWDVGTGQLLLTLAGEHQATIWAAAFNRAGDRLATGDEKGGIVVWDPTNGRALLKIDSAQESIWDLVWSPDGTTLASAGGNGTVRLWPTSGSKAAEATVGKP